ncbi:hypothetical protein, partial [Pseudomonas folii]|uniref:hypothetical protein n=1 Tax=Pseudomonas folii TaxID=2762593 RepID=UPI001BE465ED
PQGIVEHHPRPYRNQYTVTISIRHWHIPSRQGFDPPRICNLIHAVSISLQGNAKQLSGKPSTN